LVFPEALVTTMIVENNTMKPNQIRKKEEWRRKCPIYGDDFSWSDYLFSDHVSFKEFLIELD